MRPHLIRAGLFIVSSILWASSPTLSQAQPNETFEGVPVRPLAFPDLAAAWFFNNQPVIYYNQAYRLWCPPDFWKFTLAHELCHVRRHLGPVVQDNYFQYVAMRRTAEDEADKFATEYWVKKDPKVVEETIKYMSNPMVQNWGDLTHKPTAVRAQQIRAWRESLEKDSKLPIDEFARYLLHWQESRGTLVSQNTQFGKMIWTGVPFPGAISTQFSESNGTRQIGAVFLQRGTKAEATAAFDRLTAAAGRIQGIWIESMRQMSPTERYRFIDYFVRDTCVVKIGIDVDLETFLKGQEVYNVFIQFSRNTASPEIYNR